MLELGVRRGTVKGREWGLVAGQDHPEVWEQGRRSLSPTAATCRSGALPRPPPGHVPKHDWNIYITLFSKSHC